MNGMWISSLFGVLNTTIVAVEMTVGQSNVHQSARCCTNTEKGYKPFRFYLNLKGLYPFSV